MSSLDRFMSMERWHTSLMLRWCCIILLASRKGSSRGVANGYLCLMSQALEILSFVDSSWADDKNNRRSFKPYYLFANNATFSWRATLLQIIALNTTEPELMVLASCCCDVIWVRKLAPKLGFLQLKPTNDYEDSTGCIFFANNMHLRGHDGCSKHIVLRICFILKLIQD